MASRKKRLTIYVLVVVAIVLVVWVAGMITKKELNVATIPVKRGVFKISLVESGELAALKSVSITAPQVRAVGRLTITRLVEEGTYVKKGDFLVEFDKSEAENILKDNLDNLKIARANLDKAIRNKELQENQLQLDLDRAERNFKEKEFEAPLIRQEAEKELELTRMRVETELAGLGADIEKLEVEVDRAEEKIEDAQKDIENLTVRAPIPGLVVFPEVWKGGQSGKMQEGDQPWPGQTIIDLPDLSTMLVETTVNEVDVSKLKVGQEVEMKLDAYPEPTFRGKVTRIGALAKAKSYDSKIRVFDVEVTLDDHDERLKPGMAAKAEIIIDTIPNSVWVPIESVFEREGKRIVYLAEGRSYRPQVVEVGPRNDIEVTITSGLSGDERICLTDPTRKEEEAVGEQTKKRVPEQPL
jgi:RND family efflux transporter MFP subunit